MRLLFRRHLADELIVALLDGELSPEERTAAEHHLAACAHCADLLARQERANRALAIELAADLAAGAPAEEVGVRWRIRPAVGAAGAGVLAGAVGALMVAGLLARRHRRALLGAA
jgi:anti-sigma factor RsiW